MIRKRRRTKKVSLKLPRIAASSASTKRLNTCVSRFMETLDTAYPDEMSRLVA